METYLSSRPRTAPLRSLPSPESAGRSVPSPLHLGAADRARQCYGFGDLSLRQSGAGYSGHTLAIRRGAARSQPYVGKISAASARSCG